MSDNLNESAAQAQTNQTVFDILGGEDKVRALVDAFYDEMDLEPRFAKLRALHPSDLSGSRDKLFWFLSGWLGGPDYFVQKFGHPRLRARHLHFAIGVTERDQWMECMALALQAEGVAPMIQEKLLQALFNTADWMRNQAE